MPSEFAHDRLVGHRGWPAVAPENSLEGMTAALATGTRWVEFDVQLTSDGVPIVIHDRGLGRTGTAPTRVLDSDWATLAGAPVHQPSRWGDRYLGAQLPMLTQMVDLIIAQHHACAFVDVRPQSVRRHGARATLDAIAPICSPAGERLILISFDQAFVALAKAASMRCGWIIRSWSEGTCRALAELSPEFVFCRYDRLPGGELPAGPWRWAVYTVDAPDRALELMARGVQLVETDDIGRMRGELAGLARSPLGG